MDSNKIKIIIVMLISAFAAVYLGIAAATAQTEAMIWVGGAVGLTICLSLGNRIWLLLPFASAIGLFIPLPGNFSTIFLTQGIVLGFCSLLFLTRRLPVSFKFTELEFWCMAFLAVVAQAYLRNPVGLNIFGSSTVGAKPYAILGMTAMTAFLLASLKVNPNDLRWWVRITMIGSILNFGLGLIAKFVPATAMYLGASFSSDIDQSDPNSREMVDQGATSRIRLFVLLRSTWQTRFPVEFHR